MCVIQCEADGCSLTGLVNCVIRISLLLFIYLFYVSFCIFPHLSISLYSPLLPHSLCQIDLHSAPFGNLRSGSNESQLCNLLGSLLLGVPRGFFDFHRLGTSASRILPFLGISLLPLLHDFPVVESGRCRLQHKRWFV